MPTFNIPMIVIKVAGNNLFGEELKGRRKREKCCVVKLSTNAMHTSLRTDKTASVGAAEELLGAATLLLSPITIASIGDTLEMRSQHFRILGMRAQFAVTGRIDHYEVDCGIGR